MKKLILLIVLSLFSFQIGYSQKVIKIKATASTGAEDGFVSADGVDVPSFSFTEPIKLVVDISSVPNLATRDNTEPMFIWGFINGCCGAPANGGDFCNSTDAGLMTKEADNVWSYTITSVRDYLQITYKQARDGAIARGRPENQTRFGFLVKARNGCGGFQTGDINVEFTGPVYVKQKYELFPFNYSQNDVVTVVYNQDIETVTAMQSLTDLYIYAKADIVGGAPKEKTGTTAEFKLKSEGNKRYSISLLPTTFFGLNPNEQIERITVEIRGATPGTAGGQRVIGKIFTLKN
jgi:hypothetical protein